jgi:predicted nuclease of predicted toxin-antitoxin system
VPDLVARVFRDRGHTVTFLRDIMPIDSPDPVVAAVGDMEGAILVSCDHDFDANRTENLKGNARPLQKAEPIISSMR